MASALIDKLVKRGHKVAFIVDRVELVKQSRDTFGAEKVSIIKAEMEKDYNPDKPIQLIMIQTFYARRDTLPDFEIDYILIDEVHQNWNGGRIREFLRIYDNAKVIGLSATPIDERGYLLEGFEDYIDLIQIPDLIKLGYLAKPICYMPESCVYDLSDVIRFAEDYLLSVTDALEIESSVNTKLDDQVIRITIDSTHNPILIGRNGKTLQALNELVKLAVSNHFHKRFRILLDINGYKDSKYSRLVRMARKFGHDVQRTKTTYTFDPMPADERRAIHNALNNMPNIRTESIGEGAQRQVQIIYVE